MLILRLAPPPAGNSLESCTLSWCEANSLEGEQCASAMQSATLTDLQEDIFVDACRTDICLWWPSEMSISVCTEVSPAQQKQLLQNPAYELEPFVTQDIEQLHVVGAAIEDNRLQLVGVDKTSLTIVLAHLERCGVYPHQVGLDAWILNAVADENELVLYSESKRTLLYQHGYCAMAIETEFVGIILRQMHLAESEPGFSAIRVADTECRELLAPAPSEEQINRITGAVKNAAAEQGVSSAWWWRQAAISTPLLNLLQGDLEPSNVWTYVRYWRPTWVAALIGTVILTGLNLGLSSHLADLTSDIRMEQASLYRSFYPDAAQVFDPPAQLRSRLSHGGYKTESLDGLLTYMSFVEHFSKLPSAKRGDLKRVSFSAKTRLLTIQFYLADVATLESLDQSLNQSGLVTAIESAREDDSGIFAQIALDLLTQT